MSGFRFTPNRGIMRTIKAAERQGLFKAAEHVKKESNELVPHERGDLERSGISSVDDNETKAAVSYDTPYAVIQHENLAFKHIKKGQAKYLETALNQEQGEVRKIIAHNIRKATT